MGTMLIKSIFKDLQLFNNIPNSTLKMSYVRNKTAPDDETSFLDCWRGVGSTLSLKLLVGTLCPGVAVSVKYKLPYAYSIG